MPTAVSVSHCQKISPIPSRCPVSGGRYRTVYSERHRCSFELETIRMCSTSSECVVPFSYLERDRLTFEVEPAGAAIRDAGACNVVRVRRQLHAAGALLCASSTPQNTSADIAAFNSAPCFVGPVRLVQTITLLANTRANDYIGVNMYVDGTASKASLPENCRASELCRLCGHSQAQVSLCCLPQCTALPLPMPTPLQSSGQALLAACAYRCAYRCFCVTHACALPLTRSCTTACRATLSQHVSCCCPPPNSHPNAL